MTNGMLWNIHKIARYSDTYMILDHNVLKFTGNLLIEKVNVSENEFYLLFQCFLCVFGVAIDQCFTNFRTFFADNLMQRLDFNPVNLVQRRFEFDKKNSRIFLSKKCANERFFRETHKNREKNYQKSLNFHNYLSI